MNRITFETAKLASEKGYNEPTNYYYSSDKKLHGSKQRLTKKSLSDNSYLAPFQAELQEYLRNKHNIDIDISVYLGRKYGFDIFHDNKMNDYDSPEYEKYKVYNTYEEALEDALRRSLTLIKNK